MKKYARQENDRFFAWVLAIVIIAFVPTSALVKHSKLEAEKHIQVIRESLDGYHFATTAFRHDEWWLPTVPAPTLESYNLLQAKKEELIALLKENRNVCAETRRIADRFQDIVPAVFMGSAPVRLDIVGQVTNDVRSVCVCFLPEDVAKREHYLLPTWNTNYNAVIIPAFVMPKEMYAAAIFHELGHALRHNRYDGQPADVEGSEPYMIEETDMHILTGKILDHMSKGRYMQRIQQIDERNKEAADFDETLESITGADRKYFDSLFGCESVDIPAQLLMSQSEIDLALQYYRSKGEPTSREKARLYGWFNKNIFRMP